MIRNLIAVFCLLAIAACAAADPETDPTVDLGDFRLLNNFAVTDAARKMGVSRDATPAEWEEVLERAVSKRFSRYQGDTPYVISYSLDGYILATKGGRLALAPRSAMSMTVHIWAVQPGNTEEPQKRLDDRSKQLLIFENLDGETVIGSGLFRDKDEQMENLGAQFARALERWLVANGDLFGVGVTDAALEAAKKDDAAAIAREVQAGGAGQGGG